MTSSSDGSSGNQQHLPEANSHPSSDKSLGNSDQRGIAERNQKLSDASLEEAGNLEALADAARARRDAAESVLEASAGETARASTKPQKRKSRPPADGERNAVVGYLGQYELAATRTLASLREGTLLAVRVADVDAGQIDDFQLHSTEQVDAHQVKWSLHPGSVGYAEFFRDAGDRTRYIRQLADGWKRLTAIHQPRRVVVHFVTNDVASSGTSQSIPRPDDSDQFGGTWSFAAFLAEAWRPAIHALRAGAEMHGVIPDRWVPAMSALAGASGLNATDWERFLADCDLEFGVPSLDASIAAAPVSDAERAVLRTDAERLAHAYMRLVARPDRRVEFTREQLLDELGWRFRAEFRNTHEFPDPDIPYRSIAATARELTDAVARFTGGYVGVVGSPGSGKSTLVTRLLRESTHRVVRYYAYVRDSVGGSLRRGEAVNFFHDLTVALDHAGLHAGATLPVDDLDLLIRRVHTQFVRAHAEWAAEGRRTIVLVDGLDHIPREQRPTQSLLDHLPHPEDLPGGVLFVLGTQTDRLQGISARIRGQLDEPGRRVVMRPLERADVLDIIVEAAADHASVPTPPERERIYDLSGGHPLALNYIINRLRHAGSIAVADTLDSVEPFREGIDSQYATIWGVVEDDIELARLLALLARTRGPVRLDWVRGWAPRQALHTVTTRLAYLFRQEYGGRWTFFHNSFRAFVIERTRDLLALGDEAELFTELADHCAEAQDRAFERADELYYRARAGDATRVLALADPESLRIQFVAGRSATTIHDDLTFALDAAVAARDIIACTRTLLCSAEFAQREYYEDQLPLAETWLELGDIDLALGSLREGAALRTSREAALRAAAALDSRGFSNEARDVFILAEPLDVLRGTAERTGRREDEIDLLEAWVAVAPRFRPVSVIVGMIQRIQATDDDVWPREEHERAAAHQDETEDRQYRLLERLADALDQLDRWEDADAVRSSLQSHDRAVGWWFWAQFVGWNDALAANEPVLAEARFAVLREAFERGSIPESLLDSAARVALASGFVRVARDVDAARRVLRGVDQPALATDASYSHKDGWAPFHQRFALNRLLGALGDRRPLSEVVPDPQTGSSSRTSRRDRGTELVASFERGVVHLGRMAGQTWTGTSLAPSDFETSARPLVRIFPQHPQLLDGAYVAIQARDGFYTRLVQVASAHGSDCVAVLQRLLHAEWSDETRRHAWPDSLMRRVLCELLLVGSPADWVRSWLAHIEPVSFSGEDLETDLPEGVAQARAWAAAGDIVAARTTLERILRAAFGVEAKDDQLNSCLAWAVSANREDPVRMPERLAQMAGAVHSLDGARAQGYIAPSLLQAGVEAGARPARVLVEWALANDIRGWVDALSILIEGLATHAPHAAGVLSTCYRSLVLPFARRAGVDAIARVATALRSAGDAKELSALAEAIEVVAIGSTRPALREAMAGRLEDAEELLRDDSVTDPTAPNQVVDAFEGLTLTLRELQTRVRTVADVEDLARRLKPNAYSYRWELILQPFLTQATADQLIAAAAAIPQTDYAWKVLANIAERLLDLHDTRSAEVIERVVRASRARGWWPGYDGGSRLTAYELLVRVSPEDGRRAAWKALHNDIASGEVRPIDVFRGWGRVIAMLAPNTSAVDIWQVVSRHVAALVAYAPQGEPPALPLAEDPSDPVAAANAISSLVANYLDHPAYALAQGAQQFFADRLLVGDAMAEAELAARLADADAPNNGALLVLRAVARVRSAVPSSVREALRGLLRASSYPDRRIAVALLGPDEALARDDGARSAGGAHSPLVERPLPAVFNLVHPPAPPRRRRPLPGRGEMLSPAEDAADLIAIFRAELDLLANWGGVQPEALYHYVAERATAYLPVDDQNYAFDDEPPIRGELSRLGLEVTYRRPRPRRVERAMAEATAMLIDHGRLGTRYFPALDRLFLSADPFFVIARPVRRPSSVAPISERAESKYVGGDWTAGVTVDGAITGRIMPGTAAAPEHDGEFPGPQQNTPNELAGADDEVSPQADGWIVLAEETWLRWLDWKHPTETRVGARLEPRVWGELDPEEDSQKIADPDEIDGEIPAGHALAVHVAEFSHLTADEYLSRGSAAYSITVRNLTYRFETPGGSWLALNPALAKHLGWQLAQDGFFRWLDADGRIAVESVWWHDGFVQQRPPLYDDEVGRGWLVRASPSAWRQLSDAVGECVDWRRVARLAQEQPTTGLVEWDPVIMTA